MVVDKTNNLKEYLKDLYDGIKTKKPDASRNPQDFKSDILSIQTGGSLPTLSNPATAEQILTDRQAYDSDGNIVTGTMVDNGLINETIDGIKDESVNIPEGYTKGGVVSLTSDIQDEVDIQEDLIDEIISIVNNKMTGSDDMLQQVVNATQNCEYLFYNYSGATLDFISNLDTSSVTNMNRMFNNCSNLTTIPALDTSSVTSMIAMFNNCSNLTTIPQLSTDNVTNMTQMFYNCRQLTTIPLLGTNKVTDMNSMFAYCSNLTTIPQLNTSNVTNMSGMFQYCSNLTSIPLLDTSSVTIMSSMLNNCSKLTTIPALDTSKVTNMNGMFNGCSNLTTIPLLDTNSVTNMASMFNSCSNLTTIPLLDTSGVTDMGYMFFRCSNLTTIPALDTSKVTNMGNMFDNCSSLKSILMTGMKVNFNISASTKFEQSDLVTILNNLATVTTTRTLTMGATNLAKLTEADKAIAANKGWTLK